MKSKTKAKWLSGSVAALALGIKAFAATNDLSATLSKGLFEEEANHDLGAAIQMY
jgi:hypothetical protein